MNIAIIFAGGRGERLHDYSRPKQFLEYRGKPVVVYTIEVFQQHPDIDGIVVACLDDWMPYLRRQIKKHHLTKVTEVVAGGRTGQDSIFNALDCAERLFPGGTVVLIHDGVRPLVADYTITENLRTVREKGSCVTCVPAVETIIVEKEDDTLNSPCRDKTMIARAPQSFILSEVLAVHRQARQEGKHNFVDTCSMMQHYGHSFHTVTGTMENIKITTPADYFMFRAIIESREEGAVFGY